MLCPKAGVGVPPKAGLLSAGPGTVKAKGALWTPEACVKEEPKGAAVLAELFCPAPKPKGAAGAAPLRAGVGMPKALAPGLCWEGAPKVNGEREGPPNTKLPVLLLVGWGLEPKLAVVEVVAVPKEKTAVVPPNAGWALVGPKEPWLLVPPKPGWELFPKAGCAADWATEAPKPNAGVLKLAGPAAGLLVGCWLSGVPGANTGWAATPGYGGGGFAFAPKAPKASVA